MSFICGGLQQRANSSAVSFDRDVYKPFPSPRQVSTLSSAFGIDGVSCAQGPCTVCSRHLSASMHFGISLWTRVFRCHCLTFLNGGVPTINMDNGSRNMLCKQIENQNVLQTCKLRFSLVGKHLSLAVEYKLSKTKMMPGRKDTFDSHVCLPLSDDSCRRHHHDISRGKR